MLIAELIQAVCASVPKPEVSVKLLSGLTLMVPVAFDALHGPPGTRIL